MVLNSVMSKAFGGKQVSLLQQVLLLLSRIAVELVVRVVAVGKSERKMVAFRASDSGLCQSIRTTLK